MKSSKTKLELIEPKILNELDGIEAWFSCKNTHLDMEEAQNIPGLNLGLNTNEQREIVEHHRSQLLSQLEIDSESIAYAGQVHSNRVQVITRGGTYAGTDALVTEIPGLALAIQVADCAAVLLADPEEKIIAAVHAGWRGAAGNILPKAIDSMLSLGAHTKNMKAFVSPCISQENFEVGEEVADYFPARFVDYQSYAKPHVDLKGFLKSQMREMGMVEAHIKVHNGCTVANEQRYYSYRREQQGSGRMLGMIRCRGMIEA